MSANLLIVDDSTSMRQMVAFALSSGGFHVREAEDGQAALDIARNERFDAVVTDVNMPTAPNRWPITTPRSAASANRWATSPKRPA